MPFLWLLSLVPRSFFFVVPSSSSKGEAPFIEAAGVDFLRRNKSVLGDWLGEEDNSFCPSNSALFDVLIGGMAGARVLKEPVGDMVGVAKAGFNLLMEGLGGGVGVSC